MNFIDARINVVSFLKTKKGKILLAILFVLFFTAITILRRPDAVTNAQFYAEDGVFWYQEAYHAYNFWEPFLLPKQGYFQTASRVGGFFGSLVDIRYAPLVFNWIAIIIQILPAIYFLSARFSKLIPRFYIRLWGSLAYLLLLGTAEIHMNITNAQWHLALLMYLVIIVPVSNRIGWKIFDNLILLLAGLSGPFIFFALPIATIHFYYRKLFKNSLDKFLILSVAFLIQLYSFFFIISDATRSVAPLGASFLTLCKILARNVFLRGILGTDYARKIAGFDLWQNGFLPVLISVVGVTAVIYVFWKAKMELKLFILFAALVFVVALASPQVSLIKPQWEVMTGGSGGRYYFLPILAWVISLGWLFFNVKYRFVKIFASICLACLIFIGLPNDYVFSKYKNYRFSQQVEEFKNTKIGETYKFRIVPKWDMYLIKK